MPHAPLSDGTRQRVRAIFSGANAICAEQMLLEECGSNLPLLDQLDPIKLERFRFAALKLSEGDLNKLRRAIDLAKRDWRDLLMAAGFAHDLAAHERWRPHDAGPPEPR